jgi:hypothetical protein
MFDPSHELPEDKAGNTASKRYLNTGPQITPRWESTLRFIGEQGAVRFDQLQHIFGRLSPEPEELKLPGVLSAERTRKILRRWTQEELFLYKVFYAKECGWVWLTRKGLKYANLDLRYYEPAPSSLPHLLALNEIRLMIAERRPDDRWRSERILRSEQDSSLKGKIAHLPDAEIVSAHKSVIGIECELTVKSEKRLEEIVFDLAGNKRYSTVWYFLPEQVYPVVKRAVRKLPEEHRKRFVFYTLEGGKYSA